jgi:GntR family transcriptional regulator
VLGEDPLAVADIFVPAPFGQQISRAEIEEHPVYQVLQNRLHLALSRATITLRSVPAPADLSESLHIDPGGSLLVMARATYDGEGRLVEAALFYLPANKFELQLNVSAAPTQELSYSFTRPGAELVLISGEGEPKPST